MGPLQKGEEHLVEEAACGRSDDMAVIEAMGEEISGREGAEKPLGDPLRRRSADADQTDPPDPNFRIENNTVISDFFKALGKIG